MAFSTGNGVNRAHIVAVPSEKVPKGEANGNVRVMYDEFVLPSDAAASAVVTLGAPIPAGARILSAKLKCADLGGTGTLDLGDAADADGYIAGGDASGQAAQLDGSGAYIGTQLAADSQTLLTMTGVTSGATGVKIRVWVSYVLY
jgi:hypothetical protein